jgi:UDP-N-acetylglucosamine 2-epimerase (non-hydrolysing)
LRTNNLYSPWPEEGNRKLVGALANLHFAPTESAYENLIKEGIPSTDIFITGNTVIDSLFLALKELENNQNLSLSLDQKYKFLNPNKKLILVTGHRRENFGEGFLNICNALSKIAHMNENIEIIYPVHLNPSVQKPVNKILGDKANIFLVEPVEYLDFIYLMKKSHHILSDSGGVQEEAPSLGKPVLLMRDTSERPEAIESGNVMMVGANEDNIISSSSKLLEDQSLYDNMSNAANPYGDGTAALKISNILKSKYEQEI